MRGHLVFGGIFLCVIVAACTSSDGGAGGKGGAGGSGGSGGAGNETGAGGSIPCGNLTCKPGEVCLHDTGGGGGTGVGSYDVCAADPCAPEALSCACADSACSQAFGSERMCGAAQDRNVTCDCPGC